MAKKHKRSSGATSKASDPRPIDPSDAKLGKKLTTYKDVADSEDEFYINQDRIAFDEDPAAKRRRLNRDAAFDSDEEELDIEGLPSEEDSDDDEEEITGRANGAGVSDDDEEDSDEEEQDEYADWGQSKKSYYGANDFENEEDAEMEEAEARRIQQKQLQSMSAKDFGVDEDEWNGTSSTTAVEGTTKAKQSTAALDDLDLDNVGKAKKITIPASEKDKLELLNVLHPEFEPLRQEYLRLAPTYEDVMAKGKDKSNRASLARRKWIVLSAYLGVLSMYFAFLNQPREKGTVVELRDHEIMEVILKWRLEWLKIEDEKEGQTPEPEDVERSMGDMSIDDDEDDEDDIDDDMSVDDEEEEDKEEVVKPIQAKPRKDTNGTKEKTKSSSSISAKEAKRLAKADDSLADLANLLPSTTTRQKPKNPKAAVQFRASDDFGDEDVLYSSDAEEKAKRKKSLRFYTAQIHQKSNKRALAGRDAGGDADLPRKERNKDRQERLNADAKKRGLSGDLGADLGDDSDYDNDLTSARALKSQIEDDGLAGDEDALDYYNAVASKSLMDKMKKKLQKEAAQTKERVVETETIDPSTGKRAIGYTIEKNKGLTPHRKKDVRNPRVKKRKKFEAAKKKLGSKKAVYKAPTGAYSGEATGIRTRIIKSTKFS
ncbi:hypothetical protein TWF730_002928 [Orbilia blumenaviensis]|uniref:Sas10 C-terminal domain-containing protein n=1 Tax=Orbilia blumenaviensis TaxID=1796055 RepID=A0AAV9U874_9PEZI